LSLEYYFQDRKAGAFKFRSTDIEKPTAR